MRGKRNKRYLSLFSPGATALRKKNGQANLKSLFKAMECDRSEEMKLYRNSSQDSLFHRNLS